MSDLSDSNAYQYKYALKKLLEDFDLKVDFNVDKLRKRKEKDRFSRDEAEKFLFVVKNSKRTTAKRDYWIFRIILETGLLPRELLGGLGLPGIESFKYSDIGGEKRIEVVRKGGIRESLRVSEDVYNQLKAGVVNRTEYYNGVEIKPMTYSNLWFIFKEYHQEAVDLGILRDRKRCGVTLLSYCDFDRYGTKPYHTVLSDLTV
jgi:integrase